MALALACGGAGCSSSSTGPWALQLSCALQAPPGWRQQPSPMPDHHLELMGPGLPGERWLVVGERQEPSLELALGAVSAALSDRGLEVTTSRRPDGGWRLQASGPTRNEAHHLLPTAPPAWATLSWAAGLHPPDEALAALDALACRSR